MKQTPKGQLLGDLMAFDLKEWQDLASAACELKGFYTAHGQAFSSRIACELAKTPKRGQAKIGRHLFYLHRYTQLAEDAEKLMFGAKSLKMDGLPEPRTATDDSPWTKPPAAMIVESFARGSLIADFVKAARLIAASGRSPVRGRPNADRSTQHAIATIVTGPERWKALPRDIRYGLPSPMNAVEIVQTEVPTIDRETLAIIRCSLALHPPDPGS